MQKTFFFTLILFYSLHSFSQKTELDNILEKWGEALAVQNLEKAIFYGEEALQFVEKNFGKNTTVYALYRNKVIFMYILNREYKKALPQAIDNYRFIQKNIGENNEAFKEALKILSIIERETGNMNAMDSIFKKQLNIYEKNTLEYTILLNDMGNHERILGNFAKSEEYLLQSIELYKNYPESNEMKAMAINNLGLLYFEMAQLDKAEKRYNEANDLIATVPNYNKEYYRIIQTNLANVYLKKRRFFEAEQIFLKNLETSIKNSIEYLSTIYSLAFLSSEIGRDEDAKKYFTECLETTEKLIGKDNEIYQASANSLAILHRKKLNFEESQRLLEWNLESINKTIGNQNFKYTSTLSNLADIFYMTGNFEKANQLFSEELEIIKNKTLKDFFILNEQEKFNYISQTESSLKAYQNFVYDYHKKIPESTGFLFDNLLFYKRLILFNTQNFKRFISNSKDTALQNNYKKLYEIKQQISKIQLQPNINTAEFKELQKQEQQTETELINKVNKYSEYSKIYARNENIGFKKLQKKLKPNQALIEFIHFDRYFKGNWTDTVYYCALILRKEFDLPQLVFLTTEEDLQATIKREKIETTPAAYINNLYKHDNQKARKLYQLIWKNMEHLLKDATEIYLSPTGLLHKIAFEALPIENNKRLKDKYHLNYVFSSKNILDSKNNSIKNIQTASLFGGAQFDLDSLQFASIYTKTEPSNIKTRSLTLFENQKPILEPLPETKDEVIEIQELLNKQNKKISIYTDLEANELNFKKLNPTDCNILHISTHGYFFSLQNKKTNSPFNFANLSTNIDNSALRSGLYLTGAQNSLNGKNKQANEDGILTAYEISMQNFENTKLLILSACETGLGDIKGYEGAVGLSRAFKSAGVENMITTLWEVPNFQTKELMKLFYTYLLQENEIEKALEMAKNDMQKKYENPFFWAGFILLY